MSVRALKLEIVGSLSAIVVAYSSKVFKFWTEVVTCGLLQLTRHGTMTMITQGTNEYSLGIKVRNFSQEAFDESILPGSSTKCLHLHET